MPEENQVPEELRDELPKELVFDDDPTELRTMPVKMKNKAGTYDEYVLVEKSGVAEIKTRNYQIRGAKLGEDGKVIGMGDIAEGDLITLSECLYKREKDKEFEITVNNQVPIATLRQWPDRVLRRLHKVLARLSDDDHPEDTEASLLEQLAEIKARLARVKRKEQEEKNS